MSKNNFKDQISTPRQIAEEIVDTFEVGQSKSIYGWEGFGKIKGEEVWKELSIIIRKLIPTYGRLRKGNESVGVDGSKVFKNKTSWDDKQFPKVTIWRSK